MQLNAGLVLTTINNPIVLVDYYNNFKKYDRLNQVKVFCIPDKKTPAEAYICCADLQRKGLDIICPTIEDQDIFLKRIGVSPNFIPYNSETRRNVGYLMALEFGSDFVISIDDDNYWQEMQKNTDKLVEEIEDILSIIRKIVLDRLNCG